LVIGRDETLNEEDQKRFLEDFKKAEINKKLDMWYYAVEQEAIWQESLDEMAALAQKEKGPAAASDE